MSLAQVAVRPCSHTVAGHAFRYALCPNQTLPKRIANVVSICLLVGTALFLAARALKGRASKSPPATSQEIRSVRYESPASILLYPIEHQCAIHWALATLQKTPPTNVRLFCAGGISHSNTHQPANVQITYLQNLFYDHWKVFEAALKSDQTKTVWNNQLVVDAAGGCMKIAYAISCLTLEDLEAFTIQLRQAGNTRTYIEALTKQDSYQYRTFFMCAQMYHDIRAGMHWNSRRQSFQYLDDSQLLNDSHWKRFYQYNSLEYSWRGLYNDYCTRIGKFVSLDDLAKADARFVNWTKPESYCNEFKPIPDTLPT
jgi:hypothetical protein